MSTKLCHFGISTRLNCLFVYLETYSLFPHTLTDLRIPTRVLWLLNRLTSTFFTGAMKVCVCGVVCVVCVCVVVCGVVCVVCVCVVVCEGGCEHFYAHSC